MKYVCSIYADRPETCVKYPWNDANQMFAECIFVDMENQKLRTMEEQLVINSSEEISNYCMDCGRCCFFGPAACSKLRVMSDEEYTNETNQTTSEKNH
jgi:Fe-S-cluster containining protein